MEPVAALLVASLLSLGGLAGQSGDSGPVAAVASLDSALYTATAPIDQVAGAIPEVELAVVAPLCEPCSITVGSEGVQTEGLLPTAEGRAQSDSPTSATWNGKAAQAVQENAPVAAGLTLTALLALLAVKLHWLSALAALPLFSRIRDDRVLDHPVRAALVAQLAAEPGSTMAHLQGRLDLRHGTAIHHLRLLERRGLVRSCPDGSSRRYWPRDHPDAARRRETVLLQRPTPQRIARFVHAHPDTHQAALCAALGLRAPTASKHLSRLEDAGLVESDRRARRRHYRPAAALAGLLSPTPEPLARGGSL